MTYELYATTANYTPGMAEHLDSEYVSQAAAGLSALLIPSAAEDELKDPG